MPPSTIKNIFFLFPFLTWTSNPLPDLFPIISAVLNTGCQQALYTQAYHTTCLGKQCMQFRFPLYGHLDISLYGHSILSGVYHIVQ